MLSDIGGTIRRRMRPLGTGVCLAVAAIAAVALPAPLASAAELCPERLVPVWQSGGAITGSAVDRRFDAQTDDLTWDEPEVRADSRPDPLSSNPAVRPAPSVWRSETFLDRLRGRPPPIPVG